MRREDILSRGVFRWSDDCVQILLQHILKECCLAMLPLELPAYVLLEIIDWLPYMKLLKHGIKINLIIKMIKKWQSKHHK